MLLTGKPTRMIANSATPGVQNWEKKIMVWEGMEFITSVLEIWQPEARENISVYRVPAVDDAFAALTGIHNFKSGGIAWGI